MAVTVAAPGLLIEVLPDIFHDLPDALGRQQRPLGVDAGNLLVLDRQTGLDRVDEVDAERQDVFVIDGVDDGVGVQFSARIVVPVKPKRL